MDPTEEQSDAEDAADADKEGPADSREPHVKAAREAVKATGAARRLSKNAKTPEQHKKAALRHEDAASKNEDAAQLAKNPAHAAVFRAHQGVHRAQADLEHQHADASIRTDEFVTRLDIGKLGKIERTAVGGIRVAARISRAGVLEYRNADGSTRRELRLPEEIKRTDSLSTLSGAPVTNQHPRTEDGLLDPTTYRLFTIGHVEDVRADGEFIEGTLVIQDAQAVDQIERGDRRDISAGYTARLDRTPGVWRGQPYDGIQRNVKFNHAAILPRGRGRAGTDVGIRLDANDAEEISSAQQEETIKMDPKKVIRIDGKEFEFGSEAHLDKIEDTHQKAIADLSEANKAERAELQTKLDEQTARLDAAGVENAKLKTDLAAARDPKALSQKVDARVALLVAARGIVGDEVKLDDKTDREVMDLVVRTDEAYAKMLEGKTESDDYMRALFAAVTATGVRTDGVTSVVRAVEHLKRTDAVDEVTQAHNENVKRNRDAWRQPLSATKEKSA